MFVEHTVTRSTLVPELLNRPRKDDGPYNTVLREFDSRTVVPDAARPEPVGQFCFPAGNASTTAPSEPGSLYRSA